MWRIWYEEREEHWGCEAEAATLSQRSWSRLCTRRPLPQALLLQPPTHLALLLALFSPFLPPFPSPFLSPHPPSSPPHHVALSATASPPCRPLISPSPSRSV
mmetsp:Transcript_28680/g.67217  ORF Transcript_28680/g.67217 Transcript_28680/m.67217 type:complete len:102 (-) Transcript_28680:16-321(-)